jgi:hypothetical protein
MKTVRVLTVAAGFAGGLLIGATSQAVRLAILEKQTAPTPQGPPETLPKFLKDTTDDDSPNTGSLEESI